MSAASSLFGNLPGIGTLQETYEQAITWGPAWNLKWIGAQIASTAADPTNSGSTWRLRPGLVMGVISASQQWTNYSATATDGSQVARGVMAYGMRMQDIFSGSNTNKLYAMVVGGQVKGANLIGLDLNARNQMSVNFMFDDSVIGTYGNALPAPIRQVTKTADYTVVASDNGTLFDNTGALGAVIITLPTLTPNFSCGILVTAGQNFTVSSAAGNDIIAFNDATASTVGFTTGGALIGGYLWFTCNPAGTFWQYQNQSSGANTISVT